jgi:mycothiol system anti-sigma-R factor
MKWIEELRKLLRRVRDETPSQDPSGGLSCQETVELLFEWLDEELEPELDARVATHLESCARCYPLLTFERAFREAVARATGNEKAPDELRDRIMESLETEGFKSS